MPQLPQNPDQAAAALNEKMEEIGRKAKEQEVQVSAAQAGLPYINLVGFAISPETVALIPKKQAKDLQAICFFSTDEEIRIGAVNPTRPEIKELLFQVQERANAKNGAVYAISAHSFAKAFKLYDTLPVVRKVTKGVAISADDLKKFQGGAEKISDLEAKLTNVTITEVVTVLVAAALEADASDIHVEAEEKDIAVRFRLDGILHDVARLPQSQWTQIASRIKLLAGLKINVTDRPQDGRFTIHAEGDEIDVRVSFLPTSFGESVVMRLLRASGAGKQVTFEGLGIRGHAQQALAEQIARPNGMIITTGPTGSGKTTTLYAILRKLNGPQVKIITLEDPVEYKLEGINQSQIDHTKDYTFAKGLRAILRQDPDVVMVGEIRDLETADIAIQAALTGHLVLSTVHTNSASGAVPRFLSMDVKPFLMAPALNAVIGQRLVRKLCPDCKKPTELPPDTLQRVKALLSKIPKASGEKVPAKLSFFTSPGCSACQGLGYRGRIGIYEIMIMDKEIEQIILSKAVSEFEMQEIAVKKGMVTMAQDGLLKALDGITSVEEVFRVAE